MFKKIKEYSSTIAVFAIVLIIILIVKSFFTISLVKGISMEPTLHDGDFIVLRVKKTIEHDDIVTFKLPTNWINSNEKTRVFIKRVVGKPGDSIEINGTELLVNGELSRTLPKSMMGCDLNLVVPEDNLFVVGDNVPFSNDSLTQVCSLDAKNPFVSINEFNVKSHYGKERVVNYE